MCVVFEGMFSVQVCRAESDSVLQETAQLSIATWNWFFPPPSAESCSLLNHPFNLIQWTGCPCMQNLFFLTASNLGKKKKILFEQQPCLCLYCHLALVLACCFLVLCFRHWRPLSVLVNHCCCRRGMSPCTPWPAWQWVPLWHEALQAPLLCAEKSIFWYCMYHQPCAFPWCVVVPTCGTGRVVALTLTCLYLWVFPVQAVDLASQEAGCKVLGKNGKNCLAVLFLFANEIFAISVVLEDSKGVITLSEECQGWGI